MCVKGVFPVTSSLTLAARSGDPVGAGLRAAQSTQAPLVNATTNTTAAGAHTHR
jgi:hypothetical protein